MVFGQLAAVLGSLLAVRVLTEYLSPDEYGELAMGMTLTTFANQVVFGPLGNGVLRYYAPAQERGDIYGYLQAARDMSLSATKLTLAVTALAVAAIFALDQRQWLEMVVAGLIFSTLVGYAGILAGIQSAARQRKVVALHQGADPFLRLLFAMGLIAWCGVSSTTVMMGFMLAAGILLVSQMLFFTKISAKAVPGAEVNNWKKDIWKFSWPISIFGIFTWIHLSSDRWALQLFSSTLDVGVYAVVFQLGYLPMSMASGLATQFMAPIFFQRAGDCTDDRRMRGVNHLGFKIVFLTLCFTLLGSGLAALLHAEIFKIFVAKNYSDQSYLLPWMILSGGLFASGQTLALNMMSRMNTRGIMKIKVLTSILGIVLNMLGAYYYGIEGVIGGIVVFSFMYMIGMMGLARIGR